MDSEVFLFKSLYSIEVTEVTDKAWFNREASPIVLVKKINQINQIKSVHALTIAQIRSVEVKTEKQSINTS
ncbi:hypothetical protein ETSB_0046 [cyanobacterium endosymbiont of Epithemia turgida isolate EtSB Lake Yunoko]|nr:hypothetical protein ETSB_0046 [cyanobacterium endosymbiont of Epithemia turgida isolate EtSB Lake Yunoko]